MVLARWRLRQAFVPALWRASLMSPLLAFDCSFMLQQRIIQHATQRAVHAITSILNPSPPSTFLWKDRVGREVGRRQGRGRCILPAPVTDEKQRLYALCTSPAYIFWDGYFFALFALSATPSWRYQWYAYC